MPIVYQKNTATYEFSIRALTLRDIEEQDARAFLDLIVSLRATVPITEFRVVDVSMPAQRWRYSFTPVDGREWQQVLGLLPNGAYDMDWTGISGRWEVREFAAHRELREHVARVLRKYVDIDRVLMTFTS